MNVGTWMTADPQTIGPTDTLAEAQEKMARGGFRRLPVVDSAGRLIGIVTERDLREHLGYLATTRVTAAIKENLITIGPDATIEAAAELMLEHKIGGLVVLSSDKRLIGVITMTDLVRGFLRSRREAEPPS